MLALQKRGQEDYKRERMWKFTVILYIQAIPESTGMKSHHHYWLNMSQTRITPIYMSR